MNNRLSTYSWFIAAAIIGPSIGQVQPIYAQPRPIYKPSKGSIESLEIASNGRLVIDWTQWKNHKYSDYWRTELDSKTGELVKQQRLPEVWRRWRLGQKAVSRRGWTALLPPPDGMEGDKVFGDHGDSSEDYSLNWLRLITPTGQVQILKRLPQFFQLSDLRFSKDGNEVLALTQRGLWRYNLLTKRARYIVRPNSSAREKMAGNIADEWSAPKEPQQVWVNDRWSENQDGAMLSPDTRFIIGYHSNVDFDAYESQWGELDRKQFYSDLLVFDATTGRIVRRIPMPFRPLIQSFESRPFSGRFTADGKYLLVEGPNWDEVVCLRWSDGKKMGVFDWEFWPYSNNSPRQAPVLSSDGRFYCDQDGPDIVVKSVLSGKVVKRAKGAIEHMEVSSQQQPFSNRLPSPLAIAPDLSALYFRPMKNNIVDNRLWKWPLVSAR